MINNTIIIALLILFTGNYGFTDNKVKSAYYQCNTSCNDTLSGDWMLCKTNYTQTKPGKNTEEQINTTTSYNVCPTLNFNNEGILKIYSGKRLLDSSKYREQDYILNISKSDLSFLSDTAFYIKFLNHDNMLEMKLISMNKRTEHILHKQ